MRIFRIVSCVLLLAWCILIFALSAQNATESSETSGAFTEKVISVIYPDFSEKNTDEQDEIIHSVTFMVRKAAHFTIFTILGIFSFLSIVSYNNFKMRIKMLLSIAFCLFYAISDEIHQLFVAGRSGEVRDVLLDTVGSALAIIILSLIFKKNKSLRTFIGGKDA